MDFPGLREQLRREPGGALARTRKQHVPLLYWTALSWGGAISLSKHDAELTADQSRAEALMRRALELDEGYEHGSIHDFFIAYEGGRASVGGSLEKARQHLERALALAKGQRACALRGVRRERLGRGAGPRGVPEPAGEGPRGRPQRRARARLSNLIDQKRARWLLERAGPAVHRMTLHSGDERIPCRDTMP